MTGIQDEDGETVVAAEIFPNMEAVEAKINVADPAADQVRTLIAEEVRDINHQLAQYKYIRSFTLRTTEFAKTTSKNQAEHLTGTTVNTREAGSVLPAFFCDLHYSRLSAGMIDCAQLTIDVVRQEVRK